MNKESIIQKIRKCLALSKSTNGHEAALAIERAHALMQKHKITRTDVELAEISSHSTAAGRSQNPPGYISILAHLVKKAFGCEPVFNPETVFFNGFNTVEFIGFGPNPQVAAYVFSVLLRQLERGRQAYLKTLSKRMKRTNKTRLADNWAEGWVMAVYPKVQEMTINEHYRRLLDEWKKRRFGRLEKTDARRAKKSGMRGICAHLEGRVAGEKAHLYRGMRGESKAMLGY